MFIHKQNTHNAHVIEVVHQASGRGDVLDIVECTAHCIRTSRYCITGMYFIENIMTFEI